MAQVHGSRPAGAKFLFHSAGGGPCMFAEKDRHALHPACSTDRKLYDQPLTIDVTFPDSWAIDRLVVTDAQGNSIAARTRAASGGPTRRLRFHAPPIDTMYFIERHVPGS